MNFCASESISSLSLSLMAELPPSRCLVHTVICTKGVKLQNKVLMKDVPVNACLDLF